MAPSIAATNHIKSTTSQKAGKG